MQGDMADLEASIFPVAMVNSAQVLFACCNNTFLAS